MRRNQECRSRRVCEKRFVDNVGWIAVKQASEAEVIDLPTWLSL